MPALASLGQQIGAIDIHARWLLPTVAVPLLLFVFLSWLLLRGSDGAYHRSRLIRGQPLAALWQTIGHTGDPPEGDSILFATSAIVLTSLVWFALSALIAVRCFVF